jgi:hypothetical protein
MTFDSPASRAPDRLVDHRPDGVVRLRGRHDPLYAAARNRDLTFANGRDSARHSSRGRPSSAKARRRT